MGKRLLIASTCICLFLGRGWAQEQGQEGRDEGNVRQSKQQPRSGQYQRPIFLSGSVILDDGHKPGEQVQVELLCQGTVLRQVYTSSGGTFSLEINPSQNANTLQPMDASVSSLSSSQLGGVIGADAGASLASGSLGSLGITRRDSINLSACELQARLPGFRSDKIILGHRRALDNPDVGVIVLHRTDSIEGGTISLKTLAAPKEAKKAFEKAGKELSKKKIKFSEVTKELEKAVEIYPEFAAAWYLLGEVLLELKDRPAASEAFEQAVAADSQYVKPYLPLAMMALEEERWEQAAQWSRQVLQVNPQLIRAHYLNALANSSLGRIDAAEESALQVQKSSQAQNYPLIHYVLGWIMSQKGNFDSAAAEYRRFLEAQPTARMAEKLKEQLSQWEEQGLIQDPELNN